MIQTVASSKNQNRMSSLAMAPCMAPLLLRPLLAGECEIETDFNVGGDNFAQLLQAAAATNHAQAIDGATPESDAYTDDDLDSASSRSCSEFGGERERERGRRGRRGSVMRGAFSAPGMIIG
ncbi:hypothetical protein KPL70_022376 [Citrus sinensis]|nr:hypothetical protein KPL70_022376 [Citrus sinensis]